MKIVRWKSPRTGKVSWVLDYSENGKRHRIVLPEAKTRKDAEKALHTYQYKKLHGKLNIETRGNLTLRECLEEHLEIKQANCIESYGKSMAHWVEEMCRILGGNHLVKSLDARVMADLKRALSMPRVDKKGDAPPTINKKLTFLKGAVRHAHQTGKIETNPLAHVEMVSDSRDQSYRWLRDDEISALLGVLRDGAEVEVKRERKGGSGKSTKPMKPYKIKVDPQPNLLNLVIFLLNTGARRGEAWKLRWGDIDHEAGCVRLMETKKAVRGRSARSRYVPLNSALRELFEKMEHRGDLVFPPDPNLRRKFTRAVEVAGLEPCRVHDLRHTFASHLAINGVPLNTIRELLGHTTIEMTLRYAHLCPSVTAQAVEGLNFGAKEAARVVNIAEPQS